MVSDGNNIPLVKKPLHQRNQQQDFYSWLRSVPFGFLQELYKQYNARRGQLPEVENFESLTPSQILERPKLEDKIVLRRSVFFLVVSIIGIEFFFDALYIVARLPAPYFSVLQFSQTKIMYIYFIFFVLVNIMKLFFIITFCLRWITTSYEIKNSEIKFKKGIIFSNQKTFLCRHTQEITCTKSFWGRLFNFGSIEIFDPTIREKIYIDSIPNPTKYVEIIKKNLPPKEDLIPPASLE